MIDNFKKFNESKRSNGNYSELAEIARTVISKIFGSYENGRYEENAYYHYGDEITWSNGVVEKGYITDFYTIKIRKEWLMMKFISKDYLKKYFAIIDRSLPHAQNDLDNATIRVTCAEGISSKRKELVSVTIWAGEEKFAKAYADINISKGFNVSKLKELENAFKDSVARISEKDLIKSIFQDWISSSKMIKRYKNQSNNFDLRKFNKHFGIAWQNSKKLNKFNDMTGVFTTDVVEEDYLTSLLKEMDKDSRGGKGVIGYTFFKVFKEYKNGIIYTNDYY